MNFNKKLFIMLSFLTVQPFVWAKTDSSKMSSESAESQEKKFVSAFNELKKISKSYPTADEAIEMIRKIFNKQLEEGYTSEEEIAQAVIGYLIKHPKLLKKEIRLEVLEKLGAQEEEIEANNQKASRKSTEQKEDISSDSNDSVPEEPVIEVPEKQNEEPNKLKALKRLGVNLDNIIEKKRNEAESNLHEDDSSVEQPDPSVEEPKKKTSKRRKRTELDKLQ